MTEFEDIKISLLAGADIGDVRSQVAGLISSGVDKENILTALTEIRREFHAAGLDAEEDAALEVMDFLVGWCAPTMRL